MNLTKTLIVPVLLGSVSLVSAQLGSGLGWHSNFPDIANPANCTQFVSSSALTGPGMILVMGPGFYSEGFGDYTRGGGRTSYIHQFRVWMQDRDPSTIDQFAFVVLLANALGQPDTTPSGLVYRSQWLPTRNTTALSQYGFIPGFPVGLDKSRKYFYGVEMSSTYRVATGPAIAYADDRVGVRGDNPRAGAPSETYVVMSGVAQLTTDLGSFAIAIGTTAPVVVTGGVDPSNTRQVPPGAINFGRGGRYPDVNGWNGSGRADDLAVGLSAFGSASGTEVAVFALAFAESRSPFAFPDFTGRFYLPLDSVLIGPVAVPASGYLTLVIPLGPRNTYTRQFVAQNDVFAQAMVINLVAQILRFSSMTQWDT